MANVCEHCGEVGEWHTIVDSFVICPRCGETLLLSSIGTTRKAMAEDVDVLHAEDLKRLRAGRGAWKKSHRPDHDFSSKPVPNRIH